MAEIIPFPVRHSNAYKNLQKFIAIADTAQSLNFYMESIGDCLDKGYITQSEAKELTRQGRERRQKMARPTPVPVPVRKPGTYIYTPEMGEKKPVCQMEASLSHYGHHYFVDTPLELKGRGITKLPDPCWNEGSKKQLEGWKSYQVTTRAYRKLEEQYTISMVSYLD